MRLKGGGRGPVHEMIRLPGTLTAILSQIVEINAMIIPTLQALPSGYSSEPQNDQVADEIHSQHRGE